MLLSYFTMRWLPSGAPAFVLIQADKLTPLLDCICLLYTSVIRPDRTCILR